MRSFGFWLLDLVFASLRNLQAKIQNPKAKMVTVGALALVALEYWAPGQPAIYTPTGKAAPAVYSWLAGPQAAQTVPHDALLLELPMDAGGSPANTSPIYLMYGLAHDRPMLNGSANIIPPG